MIMTFKIYHGKTKPIIIKGKKACELLEFAERFRNWHVINASDKPVIEKLIKKDCLELDEDNCHYRFKYPS